jgi:hypothetical protein
VVAAVVVMPPQVQMVLLGVLVVGVHLSALDLLLAQVVLVILEVSIQQKEMLVEQVEVLLVAAEVVAVVLAQLEIVQLLQHKQETVGLELFQRLAEHQLIMEVVEEEVEQVQLQAAL